MATRLMTAVLTLGAALPILCSAQDQRSEAHGASDDTLLEATTQTYEGGRWCIATFLANANSDRPHPNLSSHRSPLRLSRRVDVAQPNYSDQSSLLSRLKGLRNFRLATLWRGRDSALVLTVIDDAYVGVRLDEADHPRVRRPD